MSVVSNTPPENGGTANVYPDGSLSYSPPNGTYCGWDNFTYVANITETGIDSECDVAINVICSDGYKMAVKSSTSPENGNPNAGNDSPRPEKIVATEK